MLHSIERYQNKWQDNCRVLDSRKNNTETCNHIEDDFGGPTVRSERKPKETVQNLQYNSRCMYTGSS